MHAAAGLLKQIAEQSGTCDQKLCTLVISRLLRAKQRGLENKHVAYSLWRILQATNKTLDAVSYRTGEYRVENYYTTTTSSEARCQL